MATLATTVAVGGNSIVSLQAINNDNSDTAILDENSVTSPIIISEIVADSHQSDLTTTSGSDAFEYFELYNTSNQSINLDDYQVLYNGIDAQRFTFDTSMRQVYREKLGVENKKVILKSYNVIKT